MFLFLISLVFTSTAGYATEKLPLGPQNFAVKLDSIDFDEKALDTGYYIGLEGYGEIGRNFYVGAEVGYVNTDGELKTEEITGDTDVVFIPVELNLKYALRLSSYFVIDFGAGGSYNYAEEEVSGTSISADDWLFGGQVFTDLNFKAGQIFLGVNAKYQITDHGKDIDHNFSNWRVGGQIGVMF
jgi:hypothetical protein